MIKYKPMQEYYMEKLPINFKKETFCMVCSPFYLLFVFDILRNAGVNKI
jgi:hypothetical protein